MSGGAGRTELDRRRAAATVAVTAATVRLLARHGLPGAVPRVLGATANVVVALDGLPAGAVPLVVRSPSRTDLLAGQDPADPWRLRTELALAAALAAAGAPVVPPAGPDDVLPPGPHLVDGLTLTVWRAGRDPGPGEAGPAAVGEALAALHAAARSLRPQDLPDLPALGPVTADVAQVLATCERTGEIVPDLVPRLRHAQDVVTGPLLAADRSGWQPVHGDAHPGNVVVLDGRPVWNDLEDCCLAPPEWDLAVLRSTAVLDGAAAVRAYGRDPDDPALAAWVAGRDLQRAVWTAVRARSTDEVAAVHRLLDRLGVPA